MGRYYDITEYWNESGSGIGGYPADKNRIWVCMNDRLPTIPPYFSQTHRNAHKFAKARNKAEKAALAHKRLKHNELEWNDVYHAKVIGGVLLHNGENDYPIDQELTENSNGMKYMLAQVHPGYTIIVRGKNHQSSYVKGQRRCWYGLYYYTEIRVSPDGTYQRRQVSLSSRKAGVDEEGIPVYELYVSSVTKGLEHLLGTVIMQAYRFDGAYSVPAELMQSVLRGTGLDTGRLYLTGTEPWVSSFTGLTEFKGEVSDLDLEYSFQLGENNLVAGYGPLNYWEGAYARNYLLEQATFDCMNSMSTTWDNGIQNVQALIELAHTIADIKRGDFSSFKKTASDLWLEYRYVINTSALDTEEAIEGFMRRTLRETLAAGGQVLYTGHSSYRKGDLTLNCKCHMMVATAASVMAEQMLIELDNWGMVPDLYLLWDMIPYSFIVDWFIPVGDALAVEDANRKFAQQFVVKKCMYSFSYVRNINGVEVKNYSRFIHPPVYPKAFTWLSDMNTGASKKTVVKRLIDVAALTGGK